MKSLLFATGKMRYFFKPGCVLALSLSILASGFEICLAANAPSLNNGSGIHTTVTNHWSLSKSVNKWSPLLTHAHTLTKTTTILV